MNVVQPLNSSDCDKNFWLFLTSSYRLINAKWRAYIEDLQSKLGFHRIILLPKLLYLDLKSIFCVVAVNIADDVVLTRTNSIMK